MEIFSNMIEIFNTLFHKIIMTIMMYSWLKWIRNGLLIYVGFLVALIEGRAGTCHSGMVRWITRQH